MSWIGWACISVSIMRERPKVTRMIDYVSSRPPFGGQARQEGPGRLQWREMLLT